jgi:hypothetical protein
VASQWIKSADIRRNERRVKKIRFQPNVAAAVRQIEQKKQP